MNNNVGYKIKSIPPGFEVSDLEGRILSAGDTVLYYNELRVTYKEIPPREYLYIKPDDNSLTDFNIDITVPTGTTNYGFEWSEVNSDNTDWNAFTTASTSYGIVYSATGLTGDIIYLRGRYRGGEIQVSVTTGTGDSITDIPFSIGGYLYSIVTDEFDYLSDGTSFNGVSFYEMFNGTNITDISKLKLPNFVNEYVYSDMFYMCESLTGVSANLLPATTLANGCYYAMFQGCTSLTNAPALIATTLADDCYNSMFNECTSLINTPKLNYNGMKLAPNCYNSMFKGCTSLTESPEISDISVSGSSYSCYYMFSECTGIIKANKISIAHLGRSCCEKMFEFCTSLTAATSISAVTVDGQEACANMFYGCSSLVNAPRIMLGEQLTYMCCRDMFSYCTSLEYMPQLTATTLASNCYRTMFNNCVRLRHTDENESYRYGSIVIRDAKLAPYCYFGTFSGCSSIELVYIDQKDLSFSGNTSNLNNNSNYTYYFREMFANCSKLYAIFFEKLTNIDNFEYFQNERNRLIITGTNLGNIWNSDITFSNSGLDKIMSGMCDNNTTRRYSDVIYHGICTNTGQAGQGYITCRCEWNVDNEGLTNTTTHWKNGDSDCLKTDTYGQGQTRCIACLDPNNNGVPPCNYRHGKQIGYVTVPLSENTSWLGCVIHYGLIGTNYGNLNNNLKWIVTNTNDDESYVCSSGDLEFHNMGENTSAHDIMRLYRGNNNTGEISCL